MSKKERKTWDVVVIGAGASGMMAAITAARRNLSVLVIEHMKKAGKKLLATGNGKCNFTNAAMDERFYYGNRKLVSCVLSRFSVHETLEFFHETGIYPKEKNGYYYPNSMQAASVVDALFAEMKKHGVNLITEAGLQSLTPQNGRFLVKTTAGTFEGTDVIVATGLCAAPKLGSDGSAVSILKKAGHHFKPVLPVLCGFYARGLDFKEISGVRSEAQLSLVVEQKILLKERGELQLTEYGISGIPVFQVSSPAVRALHAGKEVTVLIDFMPGLTRKELADELFWQFNRNKNTAFLLLQGLLNQKLIPEIAKKAGTDMKHMIKEPQIHKLAAAVKQCAVSLVKVRDFTFAQACTGGICTSEIYMDTLESRLFPGLYFAGEILDADGICGGYNLQWAWASGYVAGSAVGKRKNDKDQSGEASCRT